MRSEATTVDQYLAELPEDRRAAISAVRDVMLENLDPAVVESVQYGMITYAVPHSVYPAGYHCDPGQPLPFASLASQKNHMAIYLFCLYSDEVEVERFRKAWLASGHRLDMGKSCVRFKKIDQVPLDVVGATIERLTVERFIAAYEAGLKRTPAKTRARAKAKAKAKAAVEAAPRAPAKPRSRAKT